MFLRFRICGSVVDGRNVLCVCLHVLACVGVQNEEVRPLVLHGQCSYHAQLLFPVRTRQSYQESVCCRENDVHVCLLGVSSNDSLLRNGSRKHNPHHCRRLSSSLRFVILRHILYPRRCRWVGLFHFLLVEHSFWNVQKLFWQLKQSHMVDIIQLWCSIDVHIFD